MKRVLEQPEIAARYLAAIVESSSDAIIGTDLDGIITSWNRGAGELYGYSADETIGRHARMLIPADRGHESTANAAHIERGERVASYDTVRLRKGGSPIDVSLAMSPITDAAGQIIGLASVTRDISERRRTLDLLEQRVAERTQELSLLLDISRSVASTIEPQPLLELLLDQLKTVIDYTGTAVLTRDGDDLVIAGQRGPLSDEAASQIRYPVAELAPVWDRLRRGEAVIIADVRHDTPEAEVFRRLVGEDLDGQLNFIHACLWAPLVVKDRLIGLLSITSQEPEGFTPRQAALATAIAQQAAVAIENAHLFDQVRDKAALEERQKLARELHDSVSQALYGIGLGAQTIRRMLDHNPALAVEPTEYVLSLAEAGMAEMRALIFELRPESLQTEGLAEALRKQVAALRARYGIEVVTTLADEPDVALDIKEALYRIAQEALHNTVKHAEATEASIRLLSTSSEVVLEVADNGRGFDPRASFPGHLGLQSMRERVARCGGYVEITSSSGAGARVRVSVPVGSPAP
jgi:PAS domain S-box-containing protein